MAGFEPLTLPPMDELERILEQAEDDPTSRPEPVFIEREELTEGGNAHRLERIYGEAMRYCHTHKKWLVWEDGRWQMDCTGKAMRIALNIVGELYSMAGEADSKDERAAISAWAKETDSRKGLTNMLALAANRSTFAITADVMDQDPWLLGAGAVTIDLMTGTPREPRQDDLISKSIGTAYDRSATSSLWDAFLTRIFPDLELRNYIKRAVGYCLTGSMAEQVFFFCYGMGANGKSVFLAILRALLGEYAKQADFSTFLVQRNEKVRNDLAALAGARVITATEAEEGGRLSMQVIKSWTGGDPITARFLFAENFTFKPTGKIWLAANNRPAISERNHAAWRRVRLIPFNVTIPESEQDKGLEAKLLAELPGILNWALDGLKDYLEMGLDAPKAVQEATNEYRKENDSLEQFISECCEVGKLKACKNTELYGAYQNFCCMSGLKHLSQTKFSPELSSRLGISSTRNMHGITWMGIDLKPDWRLCRVETNPTSTSGDVKHVGFDLNAQSTSNSSSRGNFTHLTPNPTQDSDSNPTYPTLIIRVLRDLGEIVLLDGRTLSLKREDVAAIPTIQAKGLIAKGAAVEVHMGGDRSASPNPCGISPKAGDPGLAEFKKKVKAWSGRNTCVSCGQHFDAPLVIASMGGYICEPCRRGDEQLTAKLEQADTQTKLADVQAN